MREQLKKKLGATYVATAKQCKITLGFHSTTSTTSGNVHWRMQRPVAISQRRTVLSSDPVRQYRLEYVQKHISITVLDQCIMKIR
jgi:hypothetical protein